MSKVDSHITLPRFYLKRWIDNDIVRHKPNMVYVFPYNKYRLKELVNIDNSFFKHTNYYATIQNDWDLDNSIENIFSASYEQDFWRFLDKMLSLINGSKKWDTIIIEDEEKEMIYDFLVYTYARSWYWETQGCCLIWQAIEWYDYSSDIIPKKVEFEYKFDGCYCVNKDKITVDKTIYNELFIKQGMGINQLRLMIKNMRISFVFPDDINNKFITNDSIFAMFERWESFEEAQYFVPLDPNLCLILWPRKKDESIWITFISKDKVDFINNSIFFIEPFKHHSRYIISYDEKGIDRIIDFFGIEPIKD